MIREKMIETLKRIAPIVTYFLRTEDLGYEFSAVVPNGVIYAEPGMLLNYSGGQWPPSEWEGKSEKEFDELFESFLLDDEWQVIAWSELNDVAIEEWLDAAIAVSPDQ